MPTFAERLWICKTCRFAAVEQKAIYEVASQACDAKVIFASLKKQIKLAKSGRPDLHFYVDPQLAEKYDINVHLVDSTEASNDGKTVTAKKTIEGDFQEETITFPSALKNEPNYLCSVVFQKPDEDVYAVSAYLIETYLGRYAWKSNYYFKKESKNSAARCFHRVIQAIKDVREDLIEKSVNASEAPYHLRRALQGISGELEPKSNQMATYLNPDNIPLKGKVPHPVYIPENRKITEGLTDKGA